MVQEPFKTNSTNEETTEYQFKDPADEGMVYDQAPDVNESTSKTEEYQGLGGEEGGDIPSSTTPPTSPKSGKGKIILFIVAGVIILLISYKLFNLVFSGPEKTAAKSVVPTLQQGKTMIPPLSMSQKAQAVVTPAALVAPSLTAPKPDAGVNQLPAALKTNDIPNKITELQKGYNSLLQVLNNQSSTSQSQLNVMNQKVENLNTSISDLQGMIQNLTAQLQKQEEEKKIASLRQAQVHKAQNTKIRSQKLYFVEAVIPGRAWIRNQEGDVSTVTVGDSIKGYGKVSSINSYSGTVMTSEGGPIYYGVNN